MNPIVRDITLGLVLLVVIMTIVSTVAGLL